jgi:polyhydroxybutyrate depolymerase
MILGLIADMMKVIAVLIWLLVLFSVETSFACGSASDCSAGVGTYRIYLPSKGPVRDIGAVIYLHGWQQTAEDVMNDEALVGTAERLGVALVAPNGKGKAWSFPSAPFHDRNDFEFIRAVIDDVVQRYPINRSRLLGAGFSLGASMIWYLACREPRLFTAYAPMSGAFWLPAPTRCAAPLPVLLHLHGLADTAVPMAGRKVTSGAEQEGVRESFVILGGPVTLQPSPAVPLNFINELHLRCERSAQQPSGGMLELCLHQGGHVLVSGWIEHAWQVMEK